MADDWVKIRTDIYRDPKVCIMADLLSKDGGPLACYVAQMRGRDMCVTRNVTRNVTVGALVTVWGVTRHRGKRDGDDLVIRSATLNLIDDIADLPGLGDAMAAVGWAIECEEGLVFPRFFAEFNTDPSVAAKEKNAERQRRHREKSNALRNVTRNVTVTSQSNAREEKSREEYSSNKKEHAGADRITDGASLPDSAITIRYEPDPAEAQRREDDAIAKAIDIVAAWPMPTAINDDIGRKLVANWVAARYLAGHGWMTAITWHSSVGGFHSMNREWWASNLRSSAAGGWKNLGKKDPGTNRGTVARRRDIPDTPDDPEAYRIAAERAREATRREATANGITQG